VGLPHAAVALGRHGEQPRTLWSAEACVALRGALYFGEGLVEVLVELDEAATGEERHGEGQDEDTTHEDSW